ncbi:hypothetical protein WJX82_011344 [Trebouxia sp. C0006]
MQSSNGSKSRGKMGGLHPDSLSLGPRSSWQTQVQQVLDAGPCDHHDNGVDPYDCYHHVPGPWVRSPWLATLELAVVRSQE